MRYPNIKSYHEGRRRNHIIPLIHRRDFLNQKPLDMLWHNKMPPANLKRDNNLFELEIALPGFKKKEIEIIIENEIMIIRAKKSISKDAKSEYVLQEFEMNVVERKFKLGKGIGHEKIKAKYKNGILKLTFIDVPVEEEQDSQRVEVV